MSEVMDSSAGKDGASVEMQVAEENHIISPEVAEEDSINSCTESVEPNSSTDGEASGSTWPAGDLEPRVKTPREVPSALDDDVSNDEVVGEDDDVNEDGDFYEDDDSDDDSSDSQVEDRPKVSVAQDGDIGHAEDPRPPANTAFICSSSLRRREIGLCRPGAFKRKALGSCSLVRRLGKERTLEYHRGCVNTLHYSEDGELLASSGDDLEIALWDWRKGQTTKTFSSGHSSNVFQAKFMPATPNNSMVSAARDGKIRHYSISPSGEVVSKTLVEHYAAAHKVAIEPGNPNTFLSCGEDSRVYEIDLRQGDGRELLKCRTSYSGARAPVRLYSIFINPAQPWYFAVSGSSHSAQVFDRRYVNDHVPVQLYSLARNADMHVSITCVVYGNDGKELLMTCNEGDIFVFNTELAPTLPVHRYEGHRNVDTIKGVNFFGPRSEYIVSGSDCGHVFLWEKSTEKVVQLLKGDEVGAVNCLEPNPRCMTLATSGLENSVKVWSPCAKEPTRLQNLDEVVRDNKSGGANAWRFINMLMRNRRFGASDSDSDSDTDSDDDDQPRHIQCVQS